MAEFAGRIRLRGREGMGKDTLLARVRALRGHLETRERKPARFCLPPRNIEGFAPGVDRLELEYPAGTPIPVIEIRPDPVERITRVFADGACVAVLSGADGLQQSDIRLVRNVEAGRDRPRSP